MTELNQQALAEDLTSKLLGVMEEMLQLNGVGEKSMQTLLNNYPERQKLFNKLCAVDFGVGHRGNAMIASYTVRRRPDKENPKGELDTDHALALLLINEVIFTNSHHWEKEWPKVAQETCYLGVNCNDIFAWGCADSEELPYNKIEEIFDYWEKDHIYGPAIWCIIQRKELPQRPVLERIKKAGIWNLDELTTEHNLRLNFYDGVSMTIARRKRDVYEAWCKTQGTEPLPFDGGWWAGWKLYTNAHPDWYNDEWKTADATARQQWIDANGHGQIVTEIL